MCVLHEENENRYLLWFFTYLLLCFVVVLLLNMLIAMFSRSFDMMYDSMTIHVQTNFARSVVAWCASPPEPPPLNLLQLPYKALQLSLSPFRSFSSQAMRSRKPSRTTASAASVAATVESSAEATTPASPSAAELP
eukprot:4238333-Prymnesium_polylepis.1